MSKTTKATTRRLQLQPQQQITNNSNKDDNNDNKETENKRKKKNAKWITSRLSPASCGVGHRGMSCRSGLTAAVSGRMFGRLSKRFPYVLGAHWAIHRPVDLHNTREKCETFGDAGEGLLKRIDSALLLNEWIIELKSRFFHVVTWLLLIRKTREWYAVGKITRKTLCCRE